MNAQNSQAQCACSAAPKFIFPRSGASDVGGLSDQAARQMAKDGTGKMHCLAGIGGGVDAIMANTQAAAKLLVIDGCSQECARKTLEFAGFKQFEHLRIPGGESDQPLGGGVAHRRPHHHSGLFQLQPDLHAQPSSRSRNQCERRNSPWWLCWRMC